MKYSCITIVFFSLLGVSQSFAQAKIADCPVVVALAKKRSSINYSLNSKPVESEMLLHALAPFVAGEGKNQAVVVMLEDAVSINDIYNVRGIIQKSGFLRISFYVYSKETLKGVELNLDPVAKPLAAIAPDWTPP